MQKIFIVMICLNWVSFASAKPCQKELSKTKAALELALKCKARSEDCQKVYEKLNQSAFQLGVCQEKKDKE